MDINCHSLESISTYVFIKSMAWAFNWSALCRSANIRISAALSIDRFIHNASSHITFSLSNAYYNDKRNNLLNLFQYSKIFNWVNIFFYAVSIPYQRQLKDRPPFFLNWKLFLCRWTSTSPEELRDRHLLYLLYCVFFLPSHVRTSLEIQDYAL